MSTTYIPAAVRRDVLLRDDGYECVYCIDGRDRLTTLDHVKSERRGGKTKRKNLLKCCSTCNNDKGSIELEFWALQLEKDTRGACQAADTIARVKAQLAAPIPKERP